MQGEDLQPLANGRYKIEEVLGMGGMATVYRATDSALQVERAIKVLSKELTVHQKLRTRFITEARTMARLRHPNVVTVFDVSVDAERPFIVMEMIEGGSLGDLIQRKGRLPVQESCSLVAQALRGVQAAHEQGVVHRDLKPDNILITVDGVPKVTDFGIAHVEDLGMALTRTGTVMGTLAYMAPEQRTNARAADARSDLFAMGATLYVALTGKEPFDIYATNVQDELLQGIPEKVEAVIRTACQYRADDRFRTATEMADVLEKIAEGIPPELIVQDVVGISAMSHDSKETISLGDLGDEELDEAAVEAAEEAVLVEPAETIPDPSFSSEEPTPDVRAVEAPANLSEPSFLLDAPSVPEPVARSNRLLGWFLAIAVGLGLAVGVVVYLQKDSESEPSASTEKADSESARSDSKESADHSERSVDQNPEDKPKSSVTSASETDAEGLDDPSPVTDGRTTETDVAEAKPEPVPVREDEANQRQQDTVSFASPQTQAEPATELVVEPEPEPEPEIVEPVEAVTMTPAPAVVGGTLNVNVRGKTTYTVFVNGSNKGTDRVAGIVIGQSQVNVKLVSADGDVVQQTITFDGGETRTLFCSGQPLNCKVRAL